MPNVATNGSAINASTKSGHVRYKIESWVPYDPGDPNADPPIPPSGGYWTGAGSGSTGAKITGTVSVSSSKMRIGGIAVAKVGDHTNESWVADPPIPSSNSSTRYTATTPTSGSDQGTISSGSSKATLQGKPIALVASSVTTGLDTTTTISAGNSKLRFNS